MIFMKRKVALLLSMALVATAVPTNTEAASVVATDAARTIKAESSSSTVGEPTTEGLEKVIREVKGKITVPSSYTEFNYNYNASTAYSDATWTLTWSNAKDYSYIQVNTDGDYHITYFYQYDNGKGSTGVAKYLKSELKAKAEDFIKKIAPETNGKLEYLDASYDGIYGGNYIYNFQRVNSGVDFPDNRVTVYVNSVTGEVTSVSINWLYGASVPASTTKVTKEQAIKLIKDNLKMKLVYRSDYIRTFKQDGSSQVKAFLVYEPSSDYISIDANTGKVYTTKAEWSAGNNYTATKEEASYDSAAGTPASSQTLTDAEIKQISELNNIISKSKAISIITGNSSLYLEDSLKNITATLVKQESANDSNSYVWNISFSDPTVDTAASIDTYSAYAYATVDAVTGKILSFYSSMNNYYNSKTQSYKNVTIKYDKKKSQAILEKFLSAQAGTRFKNSVFSTVNDDYIVAYKTDKTPVYGGYSYQYNRTNENIEYPYNYLYGAVDGVTGKIYSYGANWDENVTFESSKGAITADQAMNYYLNNEDFGLKYEIYSKNSTKDKLSTDSYSVQYAIRLVYRPDMAPAYISPFTGKQLNYNGEVYSDLQAFTYSDITDATKNRNILLLADMNIGFAGGKFIPDQSITVAEINELFSSMGYGNDTLIENSSSTKLITKEELANLFIVKLGLEKMASLSGIYKTGYLDDNNISSKYYGAVALAKGYGLMNAEINGYFNPQANITRAQAVDFLMNFINVQKTGVLY
jgi:hypothetical protein